MKRYTILIFFIILPTLSYSLDLFEISNKPVTVSSTISLSVEQNTQKDILCYNVEDLNGDKTSLPLEDESYGLCKINRPSFFNTSNRLTLNISYWRFLGGFRFDFDGILPKKPQDTVNEEDIEVSNKVKLPNGGFEGTYNFAKLYLNYISKDIEVNLGDFYSVLGKGLALSIVLNSDLNIDNTIRGGKVSIKEDFFSLTLLGGLTKYYDRTNPIKNARGENITSEGYLVGGEFKITPKELPFIGIHYVYGEDDPSDDNLNQKREEAGIVGLNIEMPSLLDGKLAILGEFDYAPNFEIFFPEKGIITEEKEKSYGIYSSINSFLGNLAILLEFKDYHYFDYSFNIPPTLEYTTMRFNKNNVIGGRIKLSYLIEETNTTISGNYGFFYDKDSLYSIPLYPLKHNHIYGEIEQQLANSAFFSFAGGYRFINGENDEDNQTKEGSGHLIHSDINFSSPLTSNQSIDLTASIEDLYFETLYKENKIKDIVTYLITSFSATINFTTYLSSSLLYSYSNEPKDKSCESILDPEADIKSNNTYLGAQIKFRPTTDSNITLFYGSEKGGYRCAGGQCKIFPSFEGIRLQAEARF